MRALPPERAFPEPFWPAHGRRAGHVNDNEGASLADDSYLALYRARYVQRLPGRLEELTGPREGVVALPLHVAWSGLREFRLDRPRQRMGQYRIVLAEGLHDDLYAYLNHELLIAQWPIMRTLISRTVREVWETAFPQLQAAGASR
ncbi:hypothetical protein ACIRL3_15620 [Streptomyces sp. NPDC102384]|uniref:hypothetical protein n=1 Tax=Streptomyces sp. NPDC102384 TaxID=3366166 RepID=UPI0037FAADE8